MEIVKKTASGFYNLLLGMKTTLGFLFTHAITLQYPKERWPMPERSRGVTALLTDEKTNRLKCTACRICEKNCPTQAIKIIPAEGKDEVTKKRYPEEFKINQGICIFCGICQEVCPFGAIKLVNKYEFSVYEKKKLVYDKNKLAEIGQGYK